MQDRRAVRRVPSSQVLDHELSGSRPVRRRGLFRYSSGLLFDRNIVLDSLQAVALDFKIVQDAHPLPSRVCQMGLLFEAMHQLTQRMLPENETAMLSENPVSLASAEVRAYTKYDASPAANAPPRASIRIQIQR